ncbi:MAG: 30S ribosomal protein S11 [Microgenomates group bacterium GW2011_GWA1_48_10]|uniref:Small ribosomal subunit protein uS11 n=1 Tax=Candidatus Gottesmanbacteria bacterium RIFCSPHIGHO2_01_FULL_47_48 TaxID=1798381 RepID=A0A1F6A2G3_9BACT|nr:MAG: 30S ribosomal protein S11 [Microgenomates group bacterium GW2011_GWA1_48_10]OGG18856.1 MAG: 30S ribosomal protein S11 [Candidatus Gottesmanbacteria bacterium RIFCSPHIGHO2_01_FULL_47_48]
MPKEKTETKKVKTKVNKQVTSGRVYVTATFNNTLITITDNSGNTLFWGSSGAAGFKGARKSTPFAATTAVDQIGRRAWDQGMRDIEVFIKGPGAGRDATLRALKTIGFNISLIADVTPIPHNGPRPKKKRRV